MPVLVMENFTNLVGASLEVSLSGQVVADFTLMSVKPGRDHDYPGRQRPPFSLFFEGPVEPFLPQGNYDFKLEELGVRPIFIVPIGQTEDRRYHYQAVFN